MANERWRSEEFSRLFGAIIVYHFFLDGIFVRGFPLRTEKRKKKFEKNIFEGQEVHWEITRDSLAKSIAMITAIWHISNGCKLFEFLIFLMLSKMNLKKK